MKVASRLLVVAAAAVMLATCWAQQGGTPSAPSALLSAAAAPAIAAAVSTCGGHVSESAGVVVETGVVDARIEVRVRDLAGDPLDASGSVPTVVEANPMRLPLFQAGATVLTATAPAIPPQRDFAIVHLQLADGRSLKVRTSLNQIEPGCPR